MYVSFLDVSQAFDWGNHIDLLRKVLSTGVSMCFLMSSAFWCCNKCYHVKWEYTLSVGCTASNDVKQGEMLSALLINLYMNELCVRFNYAPIRCCFPSVVRNHLMYKDD